MILGVWTIQKANENPVVMDEFYFDKYQDVEHNYIAIQKSQIAFDKNYNISKNLTEFKLGQNTLKLTLTDKSNNPIDNAKVIVKITRPFTNKQDIELNVTSVKDGVYRLSSFTIKELGRWQILSKVSVGDKTSFTKTDINATK